MLHRRGSCDADVEAPDHLVVAVAIHRAGAQHSRPSLLPLPPKWWPRLRGGSRLRIGQRGRVAVGNDHGGDLVVGDRAGDGGVDVLNFILVLVSSSASLLPTPQPYVTTSRVPQFASCSTTTSTPATLQLYQRSPPQSLAESAMTPSRAALAKTEHDAAVALTLNFHLLVTARNHPGSHLHRQLSDRYG